MRSLWQVSVLFSEPKIPHFTANLRFCRLRARFSALQRAENSSLSASLRLASRTLRFSALQRAENSSLIS